LLAVILLGILNSISGCADHRNIILPRDGGTGFVINKAVDAPVQVTQADNTVFSAVIKLGPGTKLLANPPVNSNPPVILSASIEISATTTGPDGKPFAGTTYFPKGTKVFIDPLSIPKPAPKPLPVASFRIGLTK
jgi:hypothetical protein